MNARPDPERPATHEPDDTRLNRMSVGVGIIATIVTIAALRFGRDVALPIVLAVLFTLLLSAPVRWLRRHRVQERYGAAVVVFGAVATITLISAMLVTPAIDWVSTAPKTMQEVEKKVRRLARPLAALQKSAEQIERVTSVPGADTTREVRIAEPGLFARASVKTVKQLPMALTVVFLTYFLLAAAPLFRRKLAQMLPGRRDVVRVEAIVAEIELVTSRFLMTMLAINTGVAAATGAALWLVGLPNPILWGVVAGVLNFVPYIGPVVTTAVVTLAALASFDDPARALLAPAVCVVIHLIESNLVTPLLLGRRLPLNTVAIFVGLIFFTWVWGIPGAVLAVPITVVFKVTCDHVPALHSVGEVLGS
jgi:predicted PurR-regulated permease PerM